MRVAVMIALALLCACAGAQLALAPPPGVDFSGHWRLNEADSDDPLRLAQAEADPSKAIARRDPQGGQSGGGRGGRQGGRGGGGPGDTGLGGPMGPMMPGMTAMGLGLRWPGREMDIKQVAGVVAITSAGLNQVYQPASFDAKPHRQRIKKDLATPRNRDMPTGNPGDGSPAHCGWEEKTLVVQASDPDDDAPAFEQRYSVSEDGQRLIEVVGFKGGRSSGFTLSRVWDRVAPGNGAVK